MSDVELSPYIFFKGNAREAMEFYKDAFGGELDISTIDEAPAGTPTMPGTKPSDVMHASLRGGAVAVLASDSPNASAQTAKVELSLDGKDEAKLRTIFDKLSEGGKVKMPLKDQFWGATFGSLTDKFGVEWMVNIQKEAA